jgi:hypothetical protein
VNLFPVTSYNGLGPGYDVAPDGRFLIVKLGASNERQEITVVENWFEELKARVPSKQEGKRQR